MIFVTVGTHEQPFDRLVEKIDEIVSLGELSEEVVIQTGYCTYEPKNCKYSKLFSYSEMNDLVNRARIVVTHGGPSSFIMPLQLGKIPIVVPRQNKYNEHVNDHQVEFVNQVSRRMGNIIACEVDSIAEKINNYDEIIKNMKNSLVSNNANFNLLLEEAVQELVAKK